MGVADTGGTPVVVGVGSEFQYILLDITDHYLPVDVVLKMTTVLELLDNLPTTL